MTGFFKSLFSRKALPSEASLSVAQASALIAIQKELQLVDVRTSVEYRLGHLPGARLIPVQELRARLKELDRSKPLLVYCRSGHRSAIALDMCRDAGFSLAVHMQPGFLGWEAAGMDVEK